MLFRSLGDTEHHGAGGEWRVEQPRVKWDVLNAVEKAATEMGIPVTPDFNTGENFGVGYFHVNQKKGVRWSSARAFLKPVLSRPNLRLETGVLVERLVFEGKRCVGVQFRQGGRVVEARAKGEVILSAGAVGSPQILQLSGVGPAEWLSQHGIAPVLDRPGVGRNLQDHLQLRLMFKCSKPITTNDDLGNWWRQMLTGMRYVFLRRGPMAVGVMTAGMTDGEIFYHIRNGIRNTGMPAWSEIGRAHV